jgi:hypothetical protein
MPICAKDISCNFEKILDTIWQMENASDKIGKQKLHVLGFSRTILEHQSFAIALPAMGIRYTIAEDMHRRAACFCGGGFSHKLASRSSESRILLMAIPRKPRIFCRGGSDFVAFLLYQPAANDCAIFDVSKL